MQFRKWGLLVCLGLLLTMSSSVVASDLNPFEYGGSENTLLGLMQNEAGNTSGGAGVFAGAGFGTNLVNVFLADLSGAGSSMSNAGVTLFVMWGNGSPPGGVYSAEVSFNDNFTEGVDGTFNDGVAEVFALGEGVSIVDGTISLAESPNGAGSIGDSDVTPRGFAITNLQSMSEGELHITFSELTGSITDVGLFDYGDPTPEMLSGDLYIPLPVIIPLPPPLGLALFGLAGVVLLRRRLIHG